MQVRFIIILRTRGYNSLNYSTLHISKFGEQTCLNTNRSEHAELGGQPDQLIQFKSFISVFLVEFSEALMSNQELRL